MEIFSDEYFMQEALKEADLALEEDEVPIGAVVVAKKRIIGRGHNQTERLNDVTAHAEMIAITSAANYMGGKYLSECTLYVTLEPCPMCAAALNWAQIGSIIYGARDVRRGFTGYTPSLIHPKTIVKAGFFEQECLALVQNFFRTKRR
ncbi:MAG: nucleoside deaminase [Bacteroidia bacterium]